LFVGNTIANLNANSILISVANSTGTANLQPTQLVIGTSTINSTALAEGANIFINTTTLFIGNSTANMIANSILVMLANSTGSANLQPTQLVIGTSTVNSTVISEGANLTINTTMIFVGNSSVNATINSSAFALNGVSVGGATPGGANTDVQFNDQGGFGGTPAFTYTKTTNNIFMANALNVGFDYQLNSLSFANCVILRYIHSAYGGL
jgi:hypothetical protein